MLALSLGSLLAHGFHTQVLEEKAVIVRVEEINGVGVGYAFYEVYAPEGTFAYQKGQADGEGLISFVPNKKGQWRIEAREDSDHGVHAVQVLVEVDEVLSLTPFKRSFFERYGGILTGLALLWAGTMTLLYVRKQKA